MAFEFVLPFPELDEVRVHGVHALSTAVVPQYQPTSAPQPQQHTGLLMSMLLWLVSGAHQPRRMHAGAHGTHRGGVCGTRGHRAPSHGHRTAGRKRAEQQKRL